MHAGNRGEGVRDLQQRLVRATSTAISDPPGYFGDATARLLGEFQTRVGLDPTTTCDRQTWALLVEAGYSLGDRLLYQRSPMLRGDDVTDLQLRLSALGFQRGRVDGIFGPDTADAVASFQRNAGLVSDGVVGPTMLEQLMRVGNRTGTTSKARVSEQLTLRNAPRRLAGRRVVIAEGGTLPALAAALGRYLDALGVHSLVIHHPDGSAQAAEANRFDAHLFLSLTSRLTAGCRLAYYQTDGFESTGGHRLADFAAQELALVRPPGEDIRVDGMRLPVLRETRMPALACELGPVDWLVTHGTELVETLAKAIDRWTIAPVADEDTDETGSSADVT